MTNATHKNRLARNAGFTLMGLLIIIALTGIAAGVMRQTWGSIMRVQREKELLWVGRQFRTALRQYYTAYPMPAGSVHAGVVPRPAELKDLLKDPRAAGVKRHLRRIYIDPMTGKDDWVLVLDERQRIKGIHSASDAATLKRDNFDPENEKFRGKTRYSEWIFEFDPATDPDYLWMTGKGGAVVVHKTNI